MSSTAWCRSRSRIHIEVALRLRNKAALDSFIEAAGRPGATERVMSPAAFAGQQHSPTTDQAQAVDFLNQSGFSNVHVASNRLLVSADGTADVVQTAFQTTLARVQTADGRDAFANTEDAHVPANLSNIVLAVLGLQTVHQAHTFARVQDPNQIDAVTGHFPTEWSSIYGGSGVANASATPVGIITQGKITQTITDLNTFTSQNGLPTVTTQTVNTNGTSTDTQRRRRVESRQPGHRRHGRRTGAEDHLLQHPDLVEREPDGRLPTPVLGSPPMRTKIINVSLGECETSAHGDGSAASQDQIFTQGVAQGQTFSISTGDDGADECGNGGITPSWPAASQFVTAVAGTRLDASTTTWNSEVVWNDLAAGNGATGGSPSTFEPKPSWQNALVSGTHRGVADVAFSGSPSSGAKIVVNGGSEQVGGTSLLGADLRRHVGACSRGERSGVRLRAAADLCAGGEQLPRHHVGQQQRRNRRSWLRLRERPRQHDPQHRDQQSRRRRGAATWPAGRELHVFTTCVA